MNSLERLNRTLQGEPTDRIPVAPIFMAFACKFAGHSYGAFQQDYRVLTECLLKTAERFDIDQLTTLSDPNREVADYGGKVTFVEDGVCRCEAPVLQDYADIDKLRRMPIEETTRMLDRLRGVERFHAERGGEISILGWVEGPIAMYCALRGMQQGMEDVIIAKDFYHEVCAITMENAIDWSRAQIEAGADMIGVGDAAASLISEGSYRELVLPWQQKLFEGIHAAGGQVRLHICGNTNHVLEPMAESGADIIDLDWMVDMPRARKIFGDEITIFGQFDPVAVLLMGTPEDVVAGALKSIREGGPHRFGLMPGCEVPPSTAVENVAAFCPGAGCLMRDALEMCRAG